MKSARPLRIGLLVANPFRDLPSQVLTAMRLCQEGCVALLIPLHLGKREIWTLAPDFVLLDNLRRGKSGLVAKMASAGIRCGVLDGEGGVFPDLETYLAKLTEDAGALQAVSGYYSWGPRVARHIVSQGRLTEHQVVVTGTPRMDFYAEPWREAAVLLSPLPEGVRRPFVLLNGTFNIVNPRRANLDSVVREYVSDGNDPEVVRGWMETQRVAMQQFIDLARRLASLLPDVDFVYRPHPFEATDSYAGRFDDLPNLRLIKQGTVEGWTLRTSAIVHCGSSTAIEGAAAGVPVFSPVWIRSHLNLPTVQAVSTACESVDEIADGIRAAIAGEPAGRPSAQHALEEIVPDWYFAIDGRSHDRVAAAIVNSCSGSATVSLLQCRRILDGDFNAPLPRRMRHLVRTALNRPAPWQEEVRLDWAPDTFGVDEVRSIAATLEPFARAVNGSGWRTVQARSPREQGEYHFGYRHGRSVALTSV